MALYNADLKPLASGTYTHSYEHAQRLFLADNFRLAPKQQFLYYVCINVDQGALQSILGSLASEAVSSQSLIEQYETGLLAKRVELPRFNVNTRSLKAYNRKNIFQTGISYDPLNITFHDDAADTVTKFWNDFYTYYYRDSDYNASLYQMPHKYEPRQREGWGYTPRNGNLKPFLRNIQIFSLHNKRFTEYLLINPVITGWRHGEHDSNQSNGIMENTMTVDYETVKYRTGYVNPVDVNGFAVIHYDQTPSPISTSVTNIYTDAGLVGALTEGSTDLARPNGTGSGSGILSSILNAYRFYNNIKDTNFSQLGGLVLGQTGVALVGNAVNGALNNVVFPTQATTTQVGSQPGTVSRSSYAVPAASNAISVAGQAQAQVTGAAVGVTTALLNNFTRGVTTTGSAPVNPSTTSVFQVAATSPYISLNPQTGQPQASEQTGFVIDSTTGEITSTFTTIGTQNGGYTGDVNTNLHNIIQSKDSDGTLVSTYIYNNGDRVVLNQNSGSLSVVRSNYQDPNNLNTNPATASSLAADGTTLNPTSIQYAIDPQTGLMYTAGGTTSAYVTNTLAGTGGLIAGGYIGTALNSKLQGVFGSSVIGQTVSATLSGVAGAIVGRAVNNGLQPIINAISGTVTQGWDSATNSIKNVVGNWSGSGGINLNNPNDNVVTSVYDPDTSYWTNTYKDGSTAVLDPFNNVISSTGPSPSGLSSGFGSWFSGTPGTNADSSVLSPGYGVGIVLDGSGNPIQSGSGFLFSGGTPDQIPFSKDFYQYDDFASGGVFTTGPTYDETFTTWSYNASDYADLLP